jgi:hypothetical protein
MKKLVFCIIPLIIVLMGCVSRGTATGETNNNLPSAGMNLDAAIREAAAQMGKNLPGGTRIALISVASSSGGIRHGTDWNWLRGKRIFLMALRIGLVV